jgi:hypothetical protein
MTDPRILQLQKEIENEDQTSKSKFAFTGFGRSTDTATASEKVQTEGQKLIGAMVTIIDLETQIKSAQDSGFDTDNLYTQLSTAQQNLTGLKGKQTQRLKQLSTDILSASGNQDLKMRYNNAFSKFKSRPQGSNFLKAKSVTPTRTKKYSLEARKENIVPQRKIGSIIKGNKFGTRVLTGIKTK